jgi:cysteinyl-tRNA synthetase
VLHLFDTATERVAPLEPRHPGQLSIYLCGPTVSGEPHVGHGRLTLTWDLIRRYLVFSGFDVTLVSNVTDIDDKIINRALAEGTTSDEVAATYEKVWFETMGALGVSRPDVVPHATEWVTQMISLIGSLIDGGHAYVGGDGVYFASETVPGYGLLARQPLESLRAGARVAIEEEAGKRSPVDFVLWKFAKPGEPWWPSPWGDGRPGWHTECVVMSLGLLGDRFDLHGGGIDLAFPHHENERAQAVAAGHAFAHRWVHSGMVVAEGGEKMSKSLGNGLSLPELVATYDPRVLRLLVIQSHYRSPVVVSEASLSQVVETLRGLDAFADRHAGSPGSPGSSGADSAGAVDAEADIDGEAIAAFVERMDDDFDTPRALAQLFDLRREANSPSTPPERAAALAATVLHLFSAAFGLTLGSSSRAAPLPSEVAALVAERDAVRAAKDFARSDAIRHELVARGWIVEDGPEGTTVRR